MKYYYSIFILLMGIIATSSSTASVKVTGTFEAIKSCDAFQSKNRGTNPGFLRTKAGEEYSLIEINKKGNWDWARVIIPGVSVNEPRRWVPRSCGKASFTAAPVTSPGDCSTPNTYDSHVMALSWQAGFCEHHSNGPNKPECKDMNKGELSINHLTIHGLWPNKKACGRDYGFCAGNNVTLDLQDQTITDLGPYMPNVLYKENSGLALHEWKKHGTCRMGDELDDKDDDDYFLLSLKIRKIIDESAIGQYLSNNIGKDISIDEYKKYIKDNKTEYALKHIQLKCPNNKKYLQEVWIKLPKNIDASGGLEKLLDNAGEFNSFGNCPNTIHIEKPGKSI